MPTVLETDDTKAWHIYKETDEVKPVCKNYGPGTIHSYTKAKQKIDAKNPNPTQTKKSTQTNQNLTQFQAVVRSEMVTLN